MNEDDASELLRSVCSPLKRPKPPPSNITEEERIALSTLKEDNIVIHPADEGNAAVVMDCSYYERKETTLLVDSQRVFIHGNQKYGHCFAHF